jgi:hypothetical protein
MKLEHVINFFETYAVALLLLAIILAFIVGLVAVTLLVFNRRWLIRRKIEWLEITPPASVSKTPEATEQLFSVIHGQHAARPLKDRLLRRVPVMSFEITSTRKDGIRYLVQIEASRSLAFQKAITAYIPDAKVKVIDYSPDDTTYVVEFKETGHYVLPLTLMSAFEQHDPLAYVTGAMTKLEDNESVTLQLVIKPVKSREADKLARQIMANEDILATVNSGGLKATSKVTDMMNGVLTNTLDLASEVYYDAATSYRSVGSSRLNVREAQVKSQIARRERPARTISTFELELMGSMHKKITEPLFQVDLRVLITGNNAKNHALAFRSALDGYSVPRYQSLKVKMKLPFMHGRRVKLATMRLPALLAKNSLVLSSSEVASLYHFPSSRISRTDNLISSLSRTLPAPVSLKQNPNFDVLLAENIHHETRTPIGLTEQERERHVYVIGGTGNGKTTMLQYSIIQDMKNGKGVAVVDPHGDMAETLLRHVPPERIKDVVYFNPDDLEHPFALNLLELTPGLEGNGLLREKDIITESVVSVFRKIFSDDDSGGHRIEYVLRNAIHTALTVEGATLFTVLKLLQNATYRRSVTNNLTDEDLKDFWKNELGKAGEMQKVKMSAGITAKIGRFNVNASAKAILGQEKSTINFEEIIDSRKILICNLSKGMLGEDVSELFGITLLAKLQLASLRRARVKQSERRPYYLYVDEFQNFATPSFVQMLSESRKYKLFMIMAEQSTSQQQDQQMVSIILANVGTVICFRTGNPNDERLLLPLFSPYISEGEIANLSAYNFYARLSSVLAQEPLSGVTLLLKDDGSEAVRNAVVEASRETYAKKPEQEDKKEVAKRTTKKASMNPQKEVKQKAGKVIVPPGG